MTRITKLMGLDQLKDTPTDLFVCENSQPRECSRCRKKHTPTNDDISTRRPSCYWKQCRECREYLRIKSQLYLEKIKKEIEDENIQFSLPIYF